MRQGDIYWASLDPTQGNEKKGQRPVLIISGNAMNENLGVVIVCPFSTALKGYPGTVRIKKDVKNGLSADSDLLTFHVRSLSKSRLTTKTGQVNLLQLKSVIQALNEVLIY